MDMYPALRSRMGTWDYYVVKMSTKAMASKKIEKPNRRLCHK